MIEKQPDEVKELGVDPEVVEAACLAHDLGHPPFGHLGEQTLNKLVCKSGEEDGFEGNAQSLRIISNLAVRFEACPGLDLTRATLAACIKYPWLRNPQDQMKSKKWGYYKTESDDFKFARLNSTETTKTAEAELMDWADDIAYSIHDLEDFHRCQAIPWRIIFSNEGKNELVSKVVADTVNPTSSLKTQLRRAHTNLSKLVIGTVGDQLNAPYEGTREQRRAIRLMTSVLIGRYVNSATLVVPKKDGDPCLKITQEIISEIAILKQITRSYIITSPPLVGQQRGQSRLLEELFEDLHEQDAEKYLPKRLSYLLESSYSRGRRVADCISSLTEAETMALHARLRGHQSGSVLDPIVR